MSSGLIGKLVALFVTAAGLCIGQPTFGGEKEFKEALVGDLGEGRCLVPTNQVLSPAGDSIYLPDRPHDVALSPDGRFAAVLGMRRIYFLDAGDFEILSATTFTAPKKDSGGSYKGVRFAPDGRTVLASNVEGALERFILDETGSVKARNPILLQEGQDYLTPAGFDLSPDGRRAFVALNVTNQLAEVDLEEGRILRKIQVGSAPFDVRVHGQSAYVSNFGGNLPREGEPVGPSGRGTPVKVDPVRHIASEGTVSVVDLEKGIEVRTLEVGLHPSGLALSKDGTRLYVANANCDTVSVIDTQQAAVVETVSTRPDEKLIFGSAPNDLTLSPDETRLYVANGTNNCLCVLELAKESAAEGIAKGPERSRMVGLVPTGWYPGGLTLSPDGAQLWVANIKGCGSRNQDPALQSEWKGKPGVDTRPRAFADRVAGHNTHDYSGSVSRIPIPADTDLPALTDRVLENNRMTETISALAPPRKGVPAKPVPDRHGEPSLFQHVVYIIKENRTYDQVFGDMPEGNGEPKLCMYGEEVTPNHHKLAREFVLLDNFYCSGILSADGHMWTNEAYATSYLEKAFGGFPRSYPYDGGDALAYASSGFIWDNCLAHGKTFRTYGEFIKATVRWKDSARQTEQGTPKFIDCYRDFIEGKGEVEILGEPTIASLVPHTCTCTIGFPSIVPDVYRADAFIQELRGFEERGGFPNLSMILLPNDHTSGTRPETPTPRASVADNDLALGRIIEALSNSKYWPTTCVFVVQDDPQNGVDHVDGHRTVAFAVSPYSRLGKAVSTQYNQTGMVRTIELALGLPPMNQLDASAIPMTDCFQGRLDLTPYQAVPNRIPLDELNPQLSEIGDPDQLYWAQESLKLPLDEIDEAPEGIFNRILWHDAMGYRTPYPVEFTYEVAEEARWRDD